MFLERRKHCTYINISYPCIVKKLTSVLKLCHSTLFWMEVGWSYEVWLTIWGSNGFIGRPLHINNCLVQLSYQIWPQKSTEGSPDCWANHWYNPPHSSRTVLIQSEQKGWQNHSGPLTSSTLPLWTAAVWSTLQSSEHQNDQTQEQFLPSGNPSHEHLTLTWNTQH